MPAKSSKQFGLMSAIAHGNATKGMGGPSKEVAKEFVKETPKMKRKKFAKLLKK